MPAPLPEDKPATVDRAPRRRRRKKAGVIEIELESGRRVRVDRDVRRGAHHWAREIALSATTSG